MLGITNLFAYILGAIAIVLVPGPNSIYVLTVSARNGVKKGYAGALGIFFGDSTLMLLTALGAASVLRTNLILFNVVRLAGAAYLGYLGIRMLYGGALTLFRRNQTGPVGGEAVVPQSEPDTASFWHYSRKALMISLVNPKAILFFLSFFVQFVDPAYPYPAISFLTLGAIMQGFSMLYLSTLILAGSGLARVFSRKRKLKALLNSMIGGLFVGFGIRLAE
jgi:leucine efflux protein